MLAVAMAACGEKSELKAKQKHLLCSVSSRPREAGPVISLDLFASPRARRGSLAQENALPLYGSHATSVTGGFLIPWGVKDRVNAIESVPNPLREVKRQEPTSTPPE